MRTHSSTTFKSLMKSGHSALPGQGPDIPFAPAAPVLDKLYTLPQISEYLHIGTRSLQTAISEGRLTSSFVGRQHLVSESSIATYLERQQGTSPYGKKHTPEAQETN
jgi:excisionase family DNA binding protein